MPDALARAGIERVIVTGASRGIGRAIAEALVARGVHIAAVARDRDRLRELVDASHGRATAIEARLDDARSCETVVERSVEALGSIDALVSAAGVALHAPLDETSSESIDTTLAINVRAPLLLSRDVAEHLSSRRKKGAIVHVTSTLAERPAPETLAYAASKGALVAAVRTLALELAPRGIRVSAVSPGVVPTEMMASRDLHALARAHPLGRLVGADEVARAVLFALESEMITGSVITVDGGLSIG